MKIQEKIDIIIHKQNSLVCVGLDSEVEKLPVCVNKSQFAFNKAVIDATHDLVCAYKPNSAFYEGHGAEGITELQKTCRYIRETYPDIVIILDAKRADIGSTNTGYVQFAFDYLGVDAITLHPYLGKEALMPFLEREEKGCIILCRTSNPGSGELQDLRVDDVPLYQVIANKVVHEWNTKGNCFLVVGATYPQELAQVRKIADEMTFLVPGIGAQGGDIEKTLKAGRNKRGAGMIINSSRGIIFASKGDDFVLQARLETGKLRDMINQYR